MPEHAPVRTLSEAWLRYEAYVRSTLPPQKAETTIAQARTALLRYTLPGWGFPIAQGPRLTAQEREQGLQFLAQIPLEQIKEAPPLQEALFEQLGVAGNSRRNYRWALHNFIDWCKQQDWSHSFSASLKRVPTARQREKRGSATDVRTTPYKARTPYRLSRKEIPLSLQQELEAFNQFLTQPEPSLRRRAVTARTANDYEQQVLRLFGWLHKVQGVPLDALSLQTLVPVALAHDGQDSWSAEKQATKRLKELVHAYLQWLQASRPGQTEATVLEQLSPPTVLKVLTTWLAVSRFVHHQTLALVEWQDEKRIPAIAALRQLSREALARQKQHPPVSDESIKRMDWLEFLELTEQLRAECRPWQPQRTQSKQDGTTRGALRSLTAIAGSYQRFLCVAFLAYMPPQRQQELRRLEIALPAGSDRQFRTSHRPEKGNFLYKEEKQWWLSIAEHKISWSRPRSIPVPNLHYADGRCFYQYLEEWLWQYAAQDQHGEAVAVPGLRSCFQPQHDYLFTKKNGQPYSEPSSFMALLRYPAYRFTGKVLTPQAVRGMFVTYVGRKQDLSPTDWANLFTDMGGSSFQPTHQRLSPALAMSQEDRQWAAEIAQAFLDEQVKGASQPQAVDSEHFSFT